MSQFREVCRVYYVNYIACSKKLIFLQIRKTEKHDPKIQTYVFYPENLLQTYFTQSKLINQKNIW